MGDETTKREETPTRTGNAAKLREALAALLAWCEAHTGACAIRVAPVPDDEEAVWDERDRAMDAARAALAAPPRNCDRFDDDDDAFSAWHHALKDGDVVCVQNAFRWLFAPSAQEGGDHADA